MINIQMDKKTALVCGGAVFAVTLTVITYINPEVAMKLIDVIPWSRVAFTGGLPQ